MDEKTNGKSSVVSANGPESADESKLAALDNCPICQDEMKDSETIQTLPCAHNFHKDCIQKWIEMRNLCPLCKCVADTTHPVRELDDDRQDLTQNMIEALVHNAINPSGANFWMDLLQGSGMEFLGLPLGNIRNITIRSFVTDGDFENPEDILTDPEDIFSPDPEDIFSPDPEDIFSPDPEDIFSPDPEDIFSPDPGGFILDEVHPSFVHMLEEFRRPRGPIRRIRENVRFNPFPPSQVSLPSPQPHQSPHPLPSHCNEQAQCANCYAISCKHVIKRCSGCHQLRYCSRECQERNWADHKDWCLAHRVEARHNSD